MELTPKDQFRFTSVALSENSGIPVTSSGVAIGITSILDFPGEVTATGGIHMLVAGRTDGAISFWRTRKRSTPSVFKDAVLVSRQRHSGAVASLLYTEDARVCGGVKGVLLSGAYDRTIKIWDFWEKTGAETCVQTLRGHGQTITGILFSRGFIISCSLDGSIRTWKCDPKAAPSGRPAPFEAAHVVFGDSALNVARLSERVKGQSPWTLFIGDTAGCISLYDMDDFGVIEKRDQWQLHGRFVSLYWPVVEVVRFFADGKRPGRF